MMQLAGRGTRASNGRGLRWMHHRPRTDCTHADPADTVVLVVLYCRRVDTLFAAALESDRAVVAFVVVLDLSLMHVGG